jgi:hypothetical protein
MARTTGPILLAGGISFANQWLGNGNFDLKVIVATGIAAGGFALLEQIPPLSGFAVGVAWLAVLSVFLITPKGGASPAANLQKLTGM